MGAGASNPNRSAVAHLPAASIPKDAAREKEQDGDASDNSESHSNADSFDLNFLLRHPPEPLSEEQMKHELAELLKTYCELYQKTPHFWKLKQSPSEKFDWDREDFRNHVSILDQSYHEIYDEKYSQNLRLLYIQKAAESLVSSGSVLVLCDLILEILQKRLYYTEDGESRQRSQVSVQAQLLTDALSALWNFTDADQVTCRAIIEHGKFLPQLVKQIQTFQKLYNKDELNMLAERKVVRAGTSILHNVSLREENVQYLRELPGIKELLKAFITSGNGDSEKPSTAAADDEKQEALSDNSESESEDDSSVSETRFLSILTLAAIVTEKEADALANTKGVLAILLSLVFAALKDPHHRSQGFSFTELIQGVKFLSRNKANSRRLVKKGALPLLTEGLQSDLLDERKECIECLWWLSFLEENREEISKCEGLLEEVVQIYHNTEDPCHSAAGGVLFQIRENLRKHENKEYSSLAEQLQGDRVNRSETSGHVMLSYTKINRPVVEKIYNHLAHKGIPVWMDIHNMAEGEDSTLQTMAEAVEGSFVFLMCYSEGYKNSQYCRQEAEYATAKQKLIVPLRMQGDYKPDGWLGIILGTKFFFDFSRQELHDKNLPKLLQNIQKNSAKPLAMGTAQKVQAQRPVVMDDSHGGISYASPAVNNIALATMQHKIRQWGKDDVAKWLNKFELKEKSLETLTGHDIVFLRHLYNRAPDFFYQLVTGQLGLNKVTEVSKLASALEEVHATF